MRVLILLAFTALCFSHTFLDENSEIISQAEVDYINSVQKNWVASKSWIGSTTLKDFKNRYWSPEIEKLDVPEHKWGDFFNYTQIPSQFDSRVQWPNCVAPIKNETFCNLGFVFAATSSLAERFCINSDRFPGLDLSPQYIFNCLSGVGCSSSTSGLTNVYTYLQNTGTSVETCVPYTATKASCSIYCSDGTPVTLYKSGPSSSYLGAESIQTAIMTQGPVVSIMTVYSDFLGYKGGVYSHTGTGTAVQFQGVKIVGWGYNSTIDANYWICSNSWGVGFGIKGYFYIQFGQCKIDTIAYAVNPII
jgi:C1A family cysteine protease